MLILGIESTCDETSVGIVKDGRIVLSNVVASSSAMHEKYGGIVPEVAAREQVRVIVPILREALATSKTKLQDLDAIAIAHGPGLIGSLLVGVETAKALALAWDKPLIGVNHLVGHLYANWLSPISNLKSQVPNYPVFPAIGLVVSGGHTDLILMKSHKQYKWLGGTLDDAAGEVFDKIARLLGLPYPGGPEIEKSAGQNLKSKFESRKVTFPLPMAGRRDFKFSFSGLKTAVANYVSSKGEVNVNEVAFEFQETVCQFLAKKTFAAAQLYNAKSIIVGGGVAANKKLRELFAEKSKDMDIKFYFPAKTFSVDNGAMIAGAAYYHRNFINYAKLQADPSLYFI